MTDIFVYGTLQAAALFEAVSGKPWKAAEGATLCGYTVRPLKGNVVPIIVAAPDETVTGLFISGVDDEQMHRLDAYEGAFGYRLLPVTVDIDGQPAQAKVYFPPEGYETLSTQWSLAEWEAEHLAPAVLAASELFALDPLPSHARLRAMWPMIEARAWNKHRATPGPATLRYAPNDGDFAATRVRPPAGGFFRFEDMRVKHRTFGGDMSADMLREGFVGVDAALVLPYDPKSDKVLLVEQARFGPFLRHDPNPWMLEPVAGIVDARETPDQTALREAREEAGLTDLRLVPASSFYASPGSSSEYFYTYIGLCDLPETKQYHGGLDVENEDLRLHVIDYTLAMSLVDSGEICAGPIVFLMNWLARHRDGLRASA